MSILVADDEKPLLQFLTKGLRAEGFDCTGLSHLHELLPWIKQHGPEVVVLDRMFDDQDSVTILQAIKALPNPPMILMLTAMDEVSERVKGLQLGADDYLTKPFDFDELLARVTALRRRRPTPTQRDDDELSCGPLTLSLQQRIAKLNGTELGLTRIEFDLLYYLLEHRQKVLSRERILSRIWQTHTDPQTNIVDVYISRLRKKLDSEPSLTIQTLRGNGYRLDTHDL
ncbi:response regulator transcription factor [Aestuariibacter salexigens]|uniref:response regulator transcription factor n=1 Tax=Aestuariibacter salexigens TaxID=226010 RepID=UPI0004212F8A|nr:response regulator transcription factor [Aestuariibacter salexigens]